MQSANPNLSLTTASQFVSIARAMYCKQAGNGESP